MLSAEAVLSFVFVNRKSLFRPILAEIDERCQNCFSFLRTLRPHTAAAAQAHYRITGTWVSSGTPK